ncbi:MAG TPA: DciA family protein [Pyrinomonadaceae bacterium]|nr:DciA family protein [Pyrinomonadaceae bacterium]
MDDLIRALPKLLRAAGEAEEVVEAAAMVAWRRVAGEALRGCAVPFRLYNKRLTVAVPDTTWKKQLEAVGGQLLFRLNSMLGQPLVTFIEFRVDPQTVRDERARLQPAAPDRETAERRALERAECLAGAADAIRDEDLRRRFLLAAGSYINAQEKK